MYAQIVAYEAKQELIDSLARINARITVVEAAIAELGNITQLTQVMDDLHCVANCLEQIIEAQQS